MAAMEWKRVCCPVDFSEPTRAALRVAADLCRRFGAELLLLHADFPGKLAEELPHVGSVDAQLLALKEQAERSGVTRVGLARGAGEPVTSIVDFAKAAGVDLIVMG